MPLESDINIAINGPFWAEVANSEHPLTAMLISRSRGTCLILASNARESIIAAAAVSFSAPFEISHGRGREYERGGKEEGG